MKVQRERAPEVTRKWHVIRLAPASFCVIESPSAMILKLLASFALLVSLASCNDGEKPSPPADESPELATARKEIEFQQEDDKPEDRAAARQAALAYVRARLPDWKVKGVASAIYHANSYRCTVEIEKAGQVRFLSLYVTSFFTEDGQSHWAAEVMGESLEDAIHNAEDQRVRKRLNDALRKCEPDPGEEAEP